MTTRILPYSEWPRLIGTEAEAVWPHLDPLKSHVVVLEKDGEIIGCQILMSVLHAECMWTHPNHRTANVTRALWAATQAEARRMGARSLATAANDARMTRLLAYVGATKLDGEHYVIQVEEPCRPQ